MDEVLCWAGVVCGVISALCAMWFVNQNCEAGFNICSTIAMLSIIVFFSGIAHACYTENKIQKDFENNEKIVYNL